PAPHRSLFLLSPPVKIHSSILPSPTSLSLSLVFRSLTFSFAQSSRVDQFTAAEEIRTPRRGNSAAAGQDEGERPSAGSGAALASQEGPLRRRRDRQDRNR
ncbi:unnamed protein product, partial [Musa acuminata var. zebrina]